jgi:arylsulfatase A
VKRSREEFVAHFPHYDKDPQGPTSAIWLGDFKLIRVYETEARLLFNLKEDAAEQKNLAKEMPEKVAALDVKLSAYLKAVDAQIPKINAQYDPAKSAESLPGERRKKQDGEDGKGKPKKPKQKAQ